jgi:hypothetical protein
LEDYTTPPPMTTNSHQLTWLLRFYLSYTLPYWALGGGAAVGGCPGNTPVYVFVQKSEKVKKKEKKGKKRKKKGKKGKEGGNS